MLNDRVTVNGQIDFQKRDSLASNDCRALTSRRLTDGEQAREHAHKITWDFELRT
jgi:hypothetical protein